MIHVDRSNVKKPKSLTETALKETQDAVDFYDVEANRSLAFTFAAYKKTDVVDALNELFKGKCAYCESLYRATAPVDIEHFRPKGAIVINGKREKPGYYWLAATWDNLLPSCIDCNRARTQPFEEDDEEVREVSGKENKFPLVDESRRARYPTAETSEQGQRLLIHPCRDQPESHLEFLPDGGVRPRSRKGAASIEVYGLRRKWLREARHEHILRLAEQMTRVFELAEDLERDPDDDRTAERLERERNILNREKEDARPYAGVSRQLIEGFEAALLDGTVRAYVQELLEETTGGGPDS